MFISNNLCFVLFSCVDVNMSDFNLVTSEIDWRINDDSLILSESYIDFDECSRESEFVNTYESKEHSSECEEEILTVHALA